MWKSVVLQLFWCLLIRAEGPIHFGAPAFHHVPPVKGGEVYTAVHPYGHNGLAKEQTAISRDPFGGKTVHQHLQASHHDPFSGQTDLKHAQHAVHLNPFLGKSAVHSSRSEGHLDPAWGKAAFHQEHHKSQAIPGHSAVQEAVSGAAVSPFGNSASQQIYEASADHAHGGIAHRAQLAQSHHGINKWGGVSHHSVAGKHGFVGHGFGSLHHGAQSTHTEFDHGGYSGIKQDGYATGETYDAKHGVGELNHLSFSRKAAHDAWGNYHGVSHSTHVSKGGPLGHHHVAHIHGVHH